MNKVAAIEGKAKETIFGVHKRAREGQFGSYLFNTKYVHICAVHMLMIAV